MVRKWEWLAAIALTAACFVPESAIAQLADDHLQMCLGDNEKICEFSKKRFKAEYPKALKADYQSQRNVAWCLSHGCDDAVQKNTMLGCAWRLVIMGSGSTRVDSTDRDNFRLECGQLDKDERGAARAQAQTLMRRIYKKTLP